MTHRFLIALVILAALVATPLAADCWLDCDRAEEEAIAACDAYRNPVEYEKCVRWAMDDYYSCLDACEIGDEYRPYPGPWWLVHSNQGRCSVNGVGGLLFDVAFSSSLTGAADGPATPVAFSSVQPGAQGTLETESLPEAPHNREREMVHSLRARTVQTLQVLEQDRPERQAVTVGKPLSATANGLLEKQALR